MGASDLHQRWNPPEADKNFEKLNKKISVLNDYKLELLSICIGKSLGLIYLDFTQKQLMNKILVRFPRYGWSGFVLKEPSILKNKKGTPLNYMVTFSPRLSLQFYMLKQNLPFKRRLGGVFKLLSHV